MGSEPRPEKVAVVNDVRQRLEASDATLLTEYRGLTVDDLARLRTAVRDAGGEYKIYKNTLVRIAVRDLGLDELEALLQGPTAIAFVQGDAVMVAKSLREFSRGNPALVIKGGMLGRSFLSPRDAGALADVPPRDVLLAQLAGLMAAPLHQLAGLLQALPRNLAYGLKALLDQQGGPPPESDAPAEAAPEPTAEAEAAPEPVAEAPTAEAAPGTSTEEPSEGAPDVPSDSGADTPPGSAEDTSAQPAAEAPDTNSQESDTAHKEEQ